MGMEGDQKLKKVRGRIRITHLESDKREPNHVSTGHNNSIRRDKMLKRSNHII